MTSSGTSTDRGGDVPTPPAPAAPSKATGVPLRVVILATTGVALVAGWIFILWHHHFHLTASAVILMLGWSAVLATVYFLWRTADNTDLDDQTDWWRAEGRIEELQREKRSLLKGIKETELDRDTGKLSTADADDILGRYRKKAIEVIKLIDLIQGGPDQGDVRARIEREVRARLEIDRVKDGHKKKARKDAATPAAASVERDDGEQDEARADAPMSSTPAVDAAAADEAPVEAKEAAP